MTEPNPPRPVPGPPRPGPGPVDATAPQAASDADREGQQPFDGLDERPVSEHVAVFEAEHSRLQRELGTIDQL
jgi:hypothetical protein